MGVIIEVHDGIIFSRIEGPVSYEIEVDHLNRLLQNPWGLRNYFELYDISQATGATFTAEQMGDIAWLSTRLNEVFEQTYAAYLIKSPLIFGFSRMFMAMSELAGAALVGRQFDDKAQALAWLKRQMALHSRTEDLPRIHCGQML